MQEFHFKFSLNKMKMAVILHLCILITFVFVVKCDNENEGELDDDAVSSNLQCLVSIVCKTTILEMENEVRKVDPRKRVEVSGFRLDPNAQSKTKSIQYSKSETFLSELMDSICEDANFASVRQLIIQKVIVSQMLNNDGALDFAPDGHLSKSLNHFSITLVYFCQHCLEILEENEDLILKQFMQEVPPGNIDDIVCTKMTNYCDKDESGDSKQRSEL